MSTHHELRILQDVRTGRLYATCPTVPGFAAQGRDLDQLMDRVPRLMKALLEARGEAVGKVSVSGASTFGAMIAPRRETPDPAVVKISA